MTPEYDGALKVVQAKVMLPLCLLKAPLYLEVPNEGHQRELSVFL